MTDRWEAVNRLFDQAVGLSGDERARFLEEACAGDADLRAELESLLKADAGAGTALAGAVGAAAAALRSELAVGQRIGPYRVISEIGHGGMGTVYLAERADETFRQRVAIKLLHRGLGDDFVRRFLRERQILAGLDHPHIARLLDGGATDGGVPYFVMEHVEGLPIDRYCEAGKLDTRERLGLFRSVCEAVEYAHGRLVVHRDLKPGNILVTAEGQVKLLDFGIARLLEGGPGEETAATTALMTLDYASPEQVRGEAITTATDVYSLGAVLYTLLAGRLPHVRPSTTPFEVQKAIVEADAPPPSQFKPGLGADLDAIVAMAMRKEPGRRYHSVARFSDDVRSYLERYPVMARRGTMRYRTGKFVRRHRAAVAGATLAVLALSTTTAVAVGEARRASRRFAQVRRLATSFLFDFEREIHSLPGSTSARHLVIQTGLEYLESLAQDAGNDRTLLSELADGYDKIAEVQGVSQGANVGDTAGALVSLRKGQAIRERLLRLGPDPALNAAYIRGWLSLADVQVARKDFGGARTAIDKALALVRERSVRDGSSPDTKALDASAHRASSNVEKRTGNVRHALAESRYALAISEELAAAPGAGRKQQEQLAADLFSVGEVMIQLGDAAGAEPFYRRTVTVWETLSARSPGDAVARRRLMIAYVRLGDVLGSPGAPNLGRTAEGRAFHQKAIEIAEEAARADPRNFAAISDLMALRARMGSARLESGDPAAGLENSQLAHELAVRLVEIDPRNGEAQLNEALTRAHVAIALKAGGRLREAIDEREKAARTYDSLLEATPTDGKVVVAAVANMQRLGRFQMDAGNTDAAAKAFAKATAAGERLVAARPDDAPVLEELAAAYRGEGDLEAHRTRWPEALASYRKALEYESRCPPASAGRAALIEEAKKGVARAEAALHAAGHRQP